MGLGDKVVLVGTALRLPAGSMVKIFTFHRARTRFDPLAKNCLPRRLNTVMRPYAAK